MSALTFLNSLIVSFAAVPATPLVLAQEDKLLNCSGTQRGNGNTYGKAEIMAPRPMIDP